MKVVFWSSKTSQFWWSVWVNLAGHVPNTGSVVLGRPGGDVVLRLVSLFYLLLNALDKPTFVRDRPVVVRDPVNTTVVGTQEEWFKKNLFSICGR